MDSYNIFIDKINDLFADPHQQIQRFEEGFYDDMTPYLTEDADYSIMYLVPVTVDHLGNTIGNSVSSFSVRVYFLDLLEKDDSNERDVISDQLSITKDFVNWLKQNEDNGFNVLNTPTATPIKSIASSYVAGWYLDLDIEVEFEGSDCTIPFTGSPTPPGTCPDALVINSDGSYNESILSGGTLILPDINIEINRDVIMTWPAVVDFVLDIQNSTGTGIGEYSGGRIKIEDSNVDTSIGISGYTAVLPAETDLTLPDITHTDSDGSPVTQAAQVPMICTPPVCIDEYIRPDGWLDLPTTVDGDERLLALYAVFEDSHNFAAFTVTTTGAVDYQVDWGDGNTTTHTSGVKAEHEYAWADVGDYYASGKYRQAIIDITSTTSATISDFTANVRHSSATNDYNSGFLDVKFTSQGMTNLAAFFRGQNEQQFKLMGAFEWVGTCNVTNFSNGFENNGIVYFKGALTLCTNTSSLFKGSGIRWMEMTLPNSGVNGTGMFWSTTNLTHFMSTSCNLNGLTIGSHLFRSSKLVCFGTADAPIALGAVSFSFGFYQSFNLTHVFTTGSPINTDHLVRDCKSVTIFEMDLSASTSNNATFLSSYGLVSAEVDGATRGLDFASCNFSREGFLRILNGIGTASGAQTLNLTGNPGSGDLTAADILIGTNKGWTVLN